MKFFLALVALGGIACSFHGVHSYQVHSGKGYFSIFTSPEEKIEGVQIFLGSVLGLFKGGKLKINNEWTKIYGSTNGNLEEFILWKNENIKKITIYSKLCIRGIKIETDAGRIFTAGTPNGQRSTSFPPREGMVLNGITGYSNLICIKRIIFHWIHIPQTIPKPNTSAAPAKTTPAAPAKTTPAAPAKTTPAAPAKTTPAAPAKTTPAAPAKTTAKTTPAAPAKTTQAAPAKTTPAAPAKTTPAAPAKTTPAAPTKSTTVAPDETTPTPTAENNPATTTGNTSATPDETTSCEPDETTPTVM